MLPDESGAAVTMQLPFIDLVPRFLQLLNDSPKRLRKYHVARRLRVQTREVAASSHREHDRRYCPHHAFRETAAAAPAIPAHAIGCSCLCRLLQGFAGVET